MHYSPHQALFHGDSGYLYSQDWLPALKSSAFLPWQLTALRTQTHTGVGYEHWDRCSQKWALHGIRHVNVLCWSFFRMISFTCSGHLFFWHYCSFLPEDCVYHQRIRCALHNLFNTVIHQLHPPDFVFTRLFLPFIIKTRFECNMCLFHYSSWSYVCGGKKKNICLDLLTHNCECDLSVSYVYRLDNLVNLLSLFIHEWSCPNMLFKCDLTGLSTGMKVTQEKQK